MQQKGVATTIVQSHQSGCIDIPITQDTEDKEMYTYLWFTDTAQRPRVIDVASLDMYEKPERLLSSHGDVWHARFGPMFPGIAYKGCITANRHKDTVLHIRIGDLKADFF